MQSNIKLPTDRSGCCDKCGGHVPSNNDAVMLQFVFDHREQDAMAAVQDFFAPPRHLLPVVKDGKMICEGSPSRAQYLPGQPFDSRYPYQREYQEKIREAYKFLQEQFGEVALPS